MSTRKFAVPIVTPARIEAGIFMETDDLPLSYFQENGHMYATQPISAPFVDLVALSQPDNGVKFYPEDTIVDRTKPVQLRSVYFRTKEGAVICINTLITLEIDQVGDRKDRVCIGSGHRKVGDKQIYVGACLWFESGELTFQVHEKPEDWDYLGHTMRYSLCTANGEPLI